MLLQKTKGDYIQLPEKKLDIEYDSIEMLKSLPTSFEELTLSWPDFPQLFAVYRKTILLIDQSNHLHSYYI